MTKPGEDPSDPRITTKGDGISSLEESLNRSIMAWIQRFDEAKARIVFLEGLIDKAMERLTEAVSGVPHRSPHPSDMGLVVFDGDEVAQVHWREARLQFDPGCDRCVIERGEFPHRQFGARYAWVTPPDEDPSGGRDNARVEESGGVSGSVGGRVLPGEGAVRDASKADLRQVSGEV